jgi:dipeptidyl aminopeptidase/acylaminoacyl peptidase
VRWTRAKGTSDVTPAPFSARTRVHEYGGGSFIVQDNSIYFSNFADQRLYVTGDHSPPRPVTPEAELRYADGVIDARRQRIICVCEDHSDPGSEASNSIVALDADGGAARRLMWGNDFYSSPRLSPDGTLLAWLTWNHPSMPWDAAELWIGRLTADGSVGNVTRLAGGLDQSVCQPRFSPDGTLYFVWEKTGWWNLHRWNGQKIDALCDMQAEFAGPQWVFGMSHYAFESAARIICSYTLSGTSYLASLDTSTLQLQRMEVPCSSISAVQAGPGFAVLLAGSPEEAQAVVRLDLSNGKHEVLRRSSEVKVEERYISIPSTIEFPTENGLTAHAFYYRPKNPQFAPPPGDKPPLLVVSHGGPTSAASSTLNLSVQYWTSRGFAVADVNYGGSAGYGRDYRRRLDGQWGIVDVNDCVNCARYLTNRGDVGAQRIAIRGGSAGGYTTLAALTFRDTFAAGASYYGVSDLEALARETHKFESRYLDSLIGPYPARRDLYAERSPIYSAEHLSCPVIFFQGDEDRVVPPNQAEKMVEVLRSKGIPVAYLLFAGEQHGFRKAENIKRALDAELYFYSRIFRFDLPEPVEPVRIDNL